MVSLGFQTVDSKPVLYHPGKNLVVISDVHLGLEGSMTSKGSYIPRFQLEDIKEELEEVKKETEAEKIVVNGDLKNQYSTSHTEKKEVDEFIQHLEDLFKEVVLIKGNHDVILDNTAEKHGLELKEKHWEGEILFVHGHEEVEEEFDTLVTGHEHPALALTDKVGVKEKVPCMLHGEVEDGNIVVMPAYSKISNGSEINNMPRQEMLSPILRKNGVEQLNAIAVSREGGVYDFGKVQDL